MAELVWRGEAVEVWHGPAWESLGTGGEGRVALVLTDPPYNVGMPYPGYSDDVEWAEYWGMAESFLRASAVALREGGVLAVLVPFTACRTVAEPHPSEPRHRRCVGEVVAMAALWTVAAISCGLLYEATVSVVNSLSGEGEGYAMGSAIGSPARPRLRTVARALLVLYKGRRVVPDRSSRYVGARLDEHKNHWYCRPLWGQGLGHPTPMPRAAVVRAVTLWSNPGDLVVDPFCGSGVVLAEALREGRVAVGGDISRESCEIAVRRLRQLALPLGAGDVLRV